MPEPEHMAHFVHGRVPKGVCGKLDFCPAIAVQYDRGKVNPRVKLAYVCAKFCRSIRSSLGWVIGKVLVRVINAELYIAGLERRLRTEVLGCKVSQCLVAGVFAQRLPPLLHRHLCPDIVRVFHAAFLVYTALYIVLVPALHSMLRPKPGRNWQRQGPALPTQKVKVSRAFSNDYFLVHVKRGDVERLLNS